MFTVTRDKVLPTSVVGSWPRPGWYDAQLHGQPLSARMKDVSYREQLSDAFASLIDEQERAGLDIVTHGDYFHDDDIGGHSWLRYPLERWKGLSGDYFKSSAELPPYPPGTILRELWAGWRWPKVVGRLEANEDNPLEYAKIWRLAQARSHKPVRFGTVSSQQFSLFLDPEEGTPYEGDGKRQLIWDLATVMNEELRELAAAGCKAIQIEEPLLHFVAQFHPEKTELLDFLVDAFNREVEGLDGVEVWVHTCWGNPNMQRAAEGSYANAMELYLNRLNCDVWTVEAADDDGKILELLRPYKGNLDKKIALGVVSHRTLQVESPEEVADFTRRALESIDAENLILSSDCGFGRQGSNRMIAFYKAASIAQGANMVRRELGAAEEYVPAADPDLQVDIPEASEESRLFGGLITD